ncbi:MAG: GDP-L-fucose synthase [Candidatus Accumulibacter sp.]|uniref:GDP-L-fucose synthase family protein n=1 Tax=Accumulibacter sp. TaxID=2053492 RepID=UPI0028793843|nr:GDP-L-fucose synthase [Accumulibacter sp.]MDS4013432.1 GDP-L-fucose synthase [Accumulibacter sp.]
MARRRLFVAGHRGLIGSAILRRLAGRDEFDVVVRDRAALDLADPRATLDFFKENRPDFVVLAAGRTGGIQENIRVPADLMRENLAVQESVFAAACATDVRRLVFYASSCMYPREAGQPMAETALLTGEPEPTSLPYAVAKLAGVQACLAWNRQCGETRFLPVIPNSIFGPGDDFDPQSAHVLAALLHRFIDATRNDLPEVVLWGSGTPRREFVFADDVADATLALLESDIDKLTFPINIGSGEETSIRDLAGRIAALTGYRGTVRWDTGKPDGAPRKLLDCTRMTQWGWRAQVGLDEGIRRTLDWYREQHSLNDC